MPLQELIRRLIDILAQQEGLPPTLLERSRELQERLASGRLHLAVLGQFKRGKSSLINALLGAEVLPQGVLPVTLIPIFLRYGSRPEIQVAFEDGRTEIHPPASLKGFVSELENPRNQKGVQQV
ncbi:MAG: dynamin family protein, partial [Anaerolineae bacterium]|nr:dynamin family protein [Anaerolineae bacterium]